MSLTVIAKLTANEGQRDDLVAARYPDQAALDAHSSSHAMKELAAAVRPSAAGRPEITLCGPIGGKGH